MDNFDEEFYLALYPDVSEAVENGVFSSGEEHFLLFGQAEGRLGAPDNKITFDDDEGDDDEGYENFERIGTIRGISFSDNAIALVDSDAQEDPGEGNFGNNPSGDTIVAYAERDSITLTLASGPITEGVLSFHYSSPNQSHEVVFLDSTGAVVDRQPLEATTGELNQFTDWQREIIRFDGNVSAIQLGSAATQIGFDDISIDILGAQTNQPPIAQDDTASATGSIPTAIAVLDNDSDPDGDELTVINFAATSANGGTISQNGDQLIYVAPLAFAGTDSFIYTISDGRGALDTATVTVAVTAVNPPPVAVDDTAGVSSGGEVTIDVLDNDFDADGTAELTDFPATTANGGALSRADNGTPEDRTDDFLSYTPPDGFTGTDSFTYTVRDDFGLTATATVSVTVNPIAGNGSISGRKFQDDNGNGVQDSDENVISGVTIFLDSNDDRELDSGEESVVTDADGNYIFTDLEAGTYTVREVLLEGFTQTSPGGSGGLVVVLDAGENAENLDFGNVENSSPVAVEDPEVTTDAGTAVTIDVLSNDFDPDENPVLLTFFTTATANGGTVERDENNTPDDLTDDSLIYSPPENFSGADSITYTISDGLGGSATSTISVTVVGEEPTLNLTGEWQYSSPEDFTFLISTGFSDGAPAFAAPLDIIQNGNQVTITGFYLNSTGSGTGVISGNNITATLPIADGTGELVGTISANGSIITGTITFSDGEAENSTAIIDFTMTSQQDGGNDIIDGDAGDNLLTADFGDDFIRGFAGNDRLDGGAGNDTLDSGASTITVDQTDELDFSVTEFSVGDRPIDLVAANLNLDVPLIGNIDDLFIFTSNSGSNDLSLLQSNGDGTFTNLPLPLAFPDGVTVSSLRSADEDGDGNLDFLVGTNTENNSIVGVRTTLETFEFEVGTRPVSVALGDFNGDGNIDGAIANSGDDTVTILTNINNEDVTTDSLSVGTAPSYITAADIDSDEDQDLIVVNNGSNTVSILRNDGVGNFQMTSERAVGNSPVWATAADLNGDDAIDLAVVNSADDSISLLLNNGSGSFSEAGTIQVGSNPVSVTAADLDGDSDIDLAVVNSDDNNVSVWRNNGNASFDPSVTVTVGSNPVSVTAADLDEDGDIDLAVANSDSDDVSVILNNGLVPVSDGGSDGGGDTVTGGAGNDSFVLNGPEDGFDIITDFLPAEDSLLVSQDVFGDEFTPETVDETQFTLGTAATTPDHRFIYDIDTGTLFFDADGNGSATQVQLAILTAGIEISAADLLVVESVTVPNRPPVAASDRATIAQNATATIDVLANDFDLDDDPISLTGFEETSANGGSITVNDNGTTDDLTDDRLVYTPAVDFIGTDSFRYSISDGQGTDTGTVTLSVGQASPPDPPDPGPTSDLSVTASVSNSTPAEGEAIAYSIQVTGLSAASGIELRSQLPAGLDLQYTTTSLGVYDLSTGIWRIPTLPAGRTATLELNVEVGSGIAGETLVNEVEVISPSGVDNQGTVAITISGDNSDPIATDDEVTTDLGTPVAVEVLANDIDPDGTRLEVTGVGVAENGDTSIISNEVIYRPDAEFAGVDSFTYTISDGRGGTDTATVTVTVAENQDPTAVPDNAIATAGQTISIDVLDNDFDLDEEAIGLAAFRRQTAAGGTVVRNNNGTARDIRDDFLEYTPAAGFTGTDSFAYRIRDRQGGTDTAQVTVNVTPVGEFNGSISGMKFLDSNQNGLRDAGEQALSGWTIFLDANNNGTLDNNEQSTVTGANGSYFFGDLRAATYNVREIQQVGFQQTTPNPTIVLAAGQDRTGVNFGNAEPPVNISGFKFLDANENGLRDAGEQTLSGWTIFLDSNNNGALDSNEQSAVTGANGSYFFGELLAGTYNVREVQQANFQQTTTNPTIVLAPGQDRTGVNFGNVSNVSINIDEDPVIDDTSQIAVDDTITTTVNTDVAIAVLENDISFGFNENQLAIADFPPIADNGGTVSLDDNGTPDDTTDDLLVYSPATGFTGVDSWNYAIGNGATATVNVTVLSGSVLTGIAGIPDTFFFSSSETVAIQGFEDVIDVLGVGGGLTFSDLDITAGTGSSSGNTLISIASSNQVIAELIGVQPAIITEEDFTFI